MIDQSNCNADYSCNKGFCPSFVAIAGGTPRNLEDRALRRLKLSDFPVPEPCSSSTSLAPGQVHSILLFGVGGCGIITAGAIIGRAAHAAGLRVNVLVLEEGEGEGEGEADLREASGGSVTEEWFRELYDQSCSSR